MDLGGLDSHDAPVVIQILDAGRVGAVGESLSTPSFLVSPTPGQLAHRLHERVLRQTRPRDAQVAGDFTEG